MKLPQLFAYLDPGTGSIIAQSIIGVIAGVGVFGRRVFINLAGKVKGLFGSSKKE